METGPSGRVLPISNGRQKEKKAGLTEAAEAPVKVRGNRGEGNTAPKRRSAAGNTRRGLWGNGIWERRLTNEGIKTYRSPQFGGGDRAKGLDEDLAEALGARRTRQKFARHVLMPASARDVCRLTLSEAWRQKLTYKRSCSEALENRFINSERKVNKWEREGSFQA